MKKTANLLVSCPDRAGIVKVVTQYLFDYGANISFLEQHIEDGYFLMRIEWEIENFCFDCEDKFLDRFSEIQREFNMELKVDFKGEKRKVGLLCSKELHCLYDVIGRYLTGELNIEIPYVISNSLAGKDYVEKIGIPFYYVETKKGSFEHEKEVLKVIKENPTDLIALARYMKVLSHDFIEQANQKIINVHHSFLPSFIGAKPYDEAFERGVKIIGATSHYVIPELDRGPIIDQEVRRIKHSHDIDNLKILGRECEKTVFANAIRKHIENKIIVYKNRAIVFE
ncbi:formyltetrahydrofolate deformylase [Candidatus Gracilibacteria bacterium]|nr:formyltetrahydrofolate deformylase [Candidatus Gracilibacteria bacterium]